VRLAFRSDEYLRKLLKSAAFATRARQHCCRRGTFSHPSRHLFLQRGRLIMGFGRGVLLWLLGIPLPIVLLLALFWHH
jgi:hypothetical protein